MGCLPKQCSMIQDPIHILTLKILIITFIGDSSENQTSTKVGVRTFYYMLKGYLSYHLMAAAVFWRHNQLSVRSKKMHYCECKFDSVPLIIPPLLQCSTVQNYLGPCISASISVSLKCNTEMLLQFIQLFKIFSKTKTNDSLQTFWYVYSRHFHCLSEVSILRLANLHGHGADDEERGRWWWY